MSRPGRAPVLTDGSAAAGTPTLRKVAVSSLVLPPLTSSVRAARTFARERCGAARVPPRTCELVVLLVSELVTNAIVHAGSETRLAISTSGSSVRVEVGDDSPVHPRVLSLGPAVPHGRGVGFVDRLATTWGVRDEAGGKVVWFTVDATATAGAAGATR